MPSTENIFNIGRSQEIAQEAADTHVENNEFQAGLDEIISISKMELDLNTSMLDMGRTGVETTAKMTVGSFNNSTSTMSRGYER